MKITTKLSLAFASIAFFWGAFANAQNISYGDNMTGTLVAEGDVGTYTFEGKEGDIIYIRMRDVSQTGVDACLDLLGPSGAIIASDCTNGGTAVISNFSITSTGLYTIEAKDNNDNDTGDFGLTLQVANRPEYAAPIACGEKLNNTFPTVAAINALKFDASAGDNVIIRMRAENIHLEPSITVYDPEGNVLQVGEASADKLLRLDLTSLPSSGTYTFFAMDNTGNDDGKYSLSLEFVGENNCAEVITCNAMFEKDLNGMTAIDAYTVNVSEGETILIQMRDNENSIESQLELYDPKGNLVTAYEAPGNLSAIEAKNVEMPGMYTILSLDGGGNDGGSYAFSLRILNNDGNPCNEMIECNSLDSEHVITQCAAMNTYCFYSEGNETISVMMKENNPELEPSIYVYGKDGALIGSDKASKMAEITDLAIADAGHYTIVFCDDHGNDVGTYKVDFTQSSGPIADNTAPIASCKDLEIPLAIGGLATVTAEDLNNGCFDACGDISLSIASDEFTCDNIGENVVTLVVTDDAGNETTCESIVMVSDPDDNCVVVECYSSGLNSSYEYIKNVNIANIDNTSGNDGGYADFTDVVANVMLGQSVDLALTPGFSGLAYTEYWSVWIDFDMNGGFDDSELVYQDKGNSVLTGNFVIPNDAAVGNTKMRVSMGWGAYPSPCSDFNYGEVEDYGVTILAAPPCDDLADIWSNNDVGAVEAPGSVCYNEATDTYAISGSGDDIGESEDELHFLHQQLCGNYDVSVNVLDLEDTGIYARAGIFMRENLTTGSPYVGVVVTPGEGAYLQARKIQDGPTTVFGSSFANPTWLRLTKAGTLFTGYVSNDGVNWEVIISGYMEDIVDCLYTGIGVSSNNDGTLNTATFGSLNIEALPGAPSDEAPETKLSSSEEYKVNVYPNPASDFIYISIDENYQETAFEISLSNALGQQVMQRQIAKNSDKEIRLDFNESISSGQYLVTLKSKTNTTTKMIFINR